MATGSEIVSRPMSSFVRKKLVQDMMRIVSTCMFVKRLSSMSAASYDRVGSSAVLYKPDSTSYIDASRVKT